MLGMSKKGKGFDVRTYIKYDLVDNRKMWIDRCRGVAILIVLLGHTNPPFRKFLYGFHMPLFFILLGYLFYMRKNDMQEIGKFIKKITVSYVYPYFLFCAINYVITMTILMLTDPGRAMSVWDIYLCGILYSRGGKDWMPNCSPLWFLTALFCTLAIVYFVMKLGKKFQYALVVGLLVCSAVLAKFSIFKLPWNIDTALLGSAFCYMGIMLAERKVVSRYGKLNILKKVLYFMSDCGDCFYTDEYWNRRGEFG